MRPVLLLVLAACSGSSAPDPSVAPTTSSLDALRERCQLVGTRGLPDDVAPVDAAPTAPPAGFHIHVTADGWQLGARQPVPTMAQLAVFVKSAHKMAEMTRAKAATGALPGLATQAWVTGAADAPTSRVLGVLPAIAAGGFTDVALVGRVALEPLAVPDPTFMLEEVEPALGATDKLERRRALSAAAQAATAGCPDVPPVVLSGRAGCRAVVEAMESLDCGTTTTDRLATLAGSGLTGHAAAVVTWTFAEDAQLASGLPATWGEALPLVIAAGDRGVKLP